MLTFQRRPEETASAVAGPSRLPTQPTLQAPTPKRATKAKAKARSPTYSPSGSEGSVAPPAASRSRATKTPSRPPSRTERRYKCSHEGCDKAYFKPSRLKEHELTHTGERPHGCPHCDQTYLRASHLTAHMRTHLPSSARSFECTYEGCDKAFWTATHLKRHQAMHEQTDIYPCPHCPSTFHKANQLRDHHALAHMPAGTKSFICTHEGCSASFAMRQQLKAHEKTHDATRYTCSHPSHDSHPSFPTWSALQTHLHSAHPPECPHPECSGRVFKTAHKLKDHLKVHALREEEAERRMASEDEDGDGVKRKKRRRSSMGGADGVGKKMKKMKPEGAKRREEIAGAESIEEESRSMQDHVLPHPHPSSIPPSNPQSTLKPTAKITKPTHVDLVSGSSTPSATSDPRRYGCPVLHLPCPSAETKNKPSRCYARFWRVYDIRRHLKASHGVDLEDDEVRELLALAKEAEGGA